MKYVLIALLVFFVGCADYKSIVGQKDIEIVNLQAQVSSFSETIKSHKEQIDLLKKELKTEREKPRTPLYDFLSLFELQTFLARDKTNENKYIPSVYDCEDFCMDLIKNAEKEGYRLHFMGLPVGCMVNIKGQLLKDHTFVLAIIKNDVYLIEPQADLVFLMARLD